MVIISPLFIPMLLFKKTEDMFYSWFKITLSFALQPAIVSTFIAMIMTIYDKALYGDCIFTKTANNPASFAISNANTSTCSDSYGYLLYQLYTNKDYWSNQFLSFFQVPLLNAQAEFMPAAFKALLISFVIYKMTLNALEFASSLTKGIMINLQQKKPANKGSKEAKDKAKKGSSAGASDKTSSGKGASDKMSIRGGVK